MHFRREVLCTWGKTNPSCNATELYISSYWKLQFQCTWSDWVGLWRLYSPMMSICSRRTRFTSQAKHLVGAPFPMPSWVVAAEVMERNFTEKGYTGVGIHLVVQLLTPDRDRRACSCLLPLRLGCKLTRAGRTSLYWCFPLLCNNQPLVSASQALRQYK